MDQPSERELLGTFQLRRLEYALSRHLVSASPTYLQLIDRCALSLYADCIDAGVGDEARRLIERYRATHRRLRRPSFDRDH